MGGKEEGKVRREVRRQTFKEGLIRHVFITIRFKGTIVRIMCFTQPKKAVHTELLQLQTCILIAGMFSF